MASPFSDYSRQSLIPNYLYTSTAKSLFLEKMTNNSTPTLSSPSSPSPSPAKRNFIIPAPSEPGKIEMYSHQFYAACTAGGILSCGLTHMTVTPLDLVKCNMEKFKVSEMCQFKSLPGFPPFSNISLLRHEYTKRRLPMQRLHIQPPSTSTRCTAIDAAGGSLKAEVIHDSQISYFS